LILQRNKMDSGHMFPLLVMWIVFVFIPLPTHGYKKRLLMDNPPELESRLHQMELTIQSLTAKVDGLTSQISEKNNYISQLQNTVLNLATTVSIYYMH
jgi:peptidoglycan hydrolase CwlO-like protein